MKRAQGKSNLDIIRDYVNGVRPFVQVGYTEDLNNADRKEGERWTDGQGRKWIWKNNTKRRAPKKATFIFEKRCKHCNCDVRWGNYLDDRVWSKTQLCYDCFTKNETQMKLDGVWEYFDKARELKNERGVLSDYKTKFDATLKWCKEHENKPLEFVNEDGSLEQWQSGPDILKIREDVTRDLNIINTRLLELDNFITESESKYESAKLQRSNKSRV